MSTPPLDTDSLLRRFFSPPNRLHLDRIEQQDEDQGIGRFQRWIAPVRLPEPEATLLPCMRTPGQVEWYAVAFTDRESRRLREELVAFVGPTYSHFRGERADLDPADFVEAAVLELSGGRAFRLTAPPAGQAQAALWQALERMRQVRARRQEREPESLRPAGRVLRDFFLALRVGNRDHADELLRLLKDQYELGSWNLLFLRVQMLADLGRWEELLSLPQLPDLLRIRRPLAVTEALLSAVYRRELEDFELRADPKGAAEHFARHVYPLYAPLFAYRTGMRSPEVLKSFTLLAVTSGEPDLVLRDEILRIARLPASEQHYLVRLAELAPEPAVPLYAGDALSHAMDEWRQGHYDRVFALASEAPASIGRAQLLMQCAYEIAALEVRRAAVEAVESLPAKDRDALLGSRWARDIWTELAGVEEATGAKPPSGWVEWLERLGQGWDEAEAVDVARQGGDQWDVEELLDAPGALRSFVDGLMGGESVKVEAAIRTALPHLIAFVQRDPEWPRRDLLPLYESLLFLLATTDRGGRDELNLFNELLSALLSIGVTEERYWEVVGWGTELWERFSGLKNVDWVLDLLDLFASFPCPDEEARLRLLQAVAASYQRFVAKGQHVQPQQWFIFRRRCREVGHSELLEGFPVIGEDETSAEAEVLGFAALRNCTVALYSLTESVGQRVAAFLKDVCPGVGVEVSHDKVCTERLRAAAQNADIFVMATASSKHAATGCIEANRSKALPLLRPAGKGSASMLSALATYLAER